MSPPQQPHQNDDNDEEAATSRSSISTPAAAATTTTSPTSSSAAAAAPPPPRDDDPQRSSHHDNGGRNRNSSSSTTTTSPNHDDINENDEDHQQQEQEDEEEELSLEELLYSSASFHAIVKPVALTMVLTALAVVYINTPETIEEGEEALASAYTAFDVSSSSDNSTATTLGLSLANALIIVSVICVMTFVIVLLYKYHCIKCLLGYMMLSSAMLLGLLGGVMLDVAVNKYRLDMDVFSFYFFLYNFAVVGVYSIFVAPMNGGSGGVPMYVTQGYLIVTSVILAWQLSHFDPWTSWTLLVMLALYDLCAVLTPCGPLKALVHLMQRDDAPSMPGLLYEAHLPFNHENHRRRRRNTLQASSRSSTTNNHGGSRGDGGGRSSSTTTSTTSPNNNNNSQAERRNTSVTAATSMTATATAPAFAETETSPSDDCETTPLTPPSSSSTSPVLLLSSSRRPSTPPPISEVPVRDSSRRRLSRLSTATTASPDSSVEGGIEVTVSQDDTVDTADSYSTSTAAAAAAAAAVVSRTSVAAAASMVSNTQQEEQVETQPPPPPTGRIPFAIAKLYRLPLMEEEPRRRPSWEPLLGSSQQEQSSSSLSPNDLLAQQYTAQELRRLVRVAFPRNGGRIDPLQQDEESSSDQDATPPRRGGGQWRWPWHRPNDTDHTTTPVKYLVKNRHGTVQRTLFVDAQGRVMEERRAEEQDDEEERKERNSIKLGLGDFIFYSVLVSKAVQYSFTTFAACMLVILAGLGATLVLLAVYRHALPALPISIFLGVIFYLLTRELMEPWIENVLKVPFYV